MKFYVCSEKRKSCTLVHKFMYVEYKYRMSKFKQTLLIFLLSKIILQFKNQNENITYNFNNYEKLKLYKILMLKN